MMNLSEEYQQEIRAIIRNPELFTPSSNFNTGFFSKPFLVDKGELKGLIIKIYHPINDPDYCLKIKSIHDQYVIDLRETGILVPETFLTVVEVDKKRYLSIVQEAFTERELVRDVMVNADIETSIRLMSGVVKDAIQFAVQQTGRDNSLGFHPTLRNYACRLGKFYYFDTFPPMSGLSEKELRQVILDFAPYQIPSLIKRFAMTQMYRVTNEYYQFDLMITGIIGSSCRLRPEFAEKFLEAGRELVETSSLDEQLKLRTLEMLREPPKLSGIWTTLRKVLGKEGKPNV